MMRFKTVACAITTIAFGLGLVGTVDAGAAVRQLTATSVAATGSCAWPTVVTDGAGSATDSYASYWGTTMLSQPGAEATFQGSFPTARFMSVTLYDPNGEPLPGPSHIYDAELTPASGVNRFQAGQTGPGTFALNVVAGAAPATAAPNTIYTGTTNGEAVRVIYRIYDSGVAGDPTGGVGLPSETVSLDGVTQATYSGCAGATATSAATPRVQRTSILARRLQRAEAPGASSFAIPHLGADALAGEPAVPLWVVPNPTLSNTTNPNEDAGVIGADLYPADDEVAVFRMKAPSFADTDLGQPPWQAGQQVRYWSVCTYNTPSNNVAGCTDDANAVTSNGYATFVLSTDENRPSNATPANGINWLSIGAGPGEWDASVAYRQILASSTFTQSISRVKIRLLPFLRMGAYYPASVYCTVTEFEQAGATGCLSGR